MMPARAATARHHAGGSLMSATTITTISTEQLAQRFNDDVGVHVWNVLTDEWFKGELIPDRAACPAIDRRGGAPLDPRQGRLDRRLLCGASVPGQPSGGGEAGGLRVHARRGLRGRPRGMEAGRLRHRRHRHHGLRRGAAMWNDTAFTRRFERRFPIVQGPFGGGLSSPRAGGDRVQRGWPRVLRRAGDDAGSDPRRRRRDSGRSPTSRSR